jgi:surface protein
LWPQRLPLWGTCIVLCFHLIIRLCCCHVYGCYMYLLSKFVCLYPFSSPKPVFRDSGFKRTLCGGKWQSLSSNSYLTSTGRLGCCPIGSFMSNPFVAFSWIDSCTACPSNALTTIANDDITCNNNVCPTGMVYLDTFYGCVKKVPNGDGSDSATGGEGSLRRAVSDWIAGGTSKSTVVATYGPIEDWDVSGVNNMAKVFYNFGSFNADLSKWVTSAVTDMSYSKCTLSPSLWPRRFPLLCILNIYDNSRFVGSQVSHVLLFLFAV